jgi:hypothetical protein
MTQSLRAIGGRRAALRGLADGSIAAAPPRAARPAE